MRGTRSEKAYKAWKDGQKYLPITSQAEFDKCLALAKQAKGHDSEFARGLGRLSYLYVTGVIEKWEFTQEPESKWTDKKLLVEAGKLANRAVKLDKYDYDNHWALAFVHLNRGRGTLAASEFEEALRLNDNNMNLLAEMADSLVYLGKFDRAIEKIKRARRIWDWHRWVLAWAYYFKGKKDKVFYDMALDELKQMHLGPHEDRFPADVLLLEGAILAQKGEKSKAKAVRTLFLKMRPDWNFEKWNKTGAFKNKTDEKHWRDGLSKAGLAPS